MVRKNGDMLQVIKDVTLHLQYKHNTMQTLIHCFVKQLMTAISNF